MNKVLSHDFYSSEPLDIVIDSEVSSRVLYPYAARRNLSTQGVVDEIMRNLAEDEDYRSLAFSVLPPTTEETAGDWVTRWVVWIASCP